MEFCILPVLSGTLNKKSLSEWTVCAVIFKLELPKACVNIQLLNSSPFFHKQIDFHIEHFAKRGL